MRKNRFLAMLIAILFAASVFGASFFIAEELHHDCAGMGHCPICEQIEQCEALLATTFVAGAIALAVYVPVLRISSVKAFKELFCRKETLITLKAELLN